MLEKHARAGGGSWNPWQLWRGLWGDTADHRPRAVFVQPFTHLHVTAAAWLLLPEPGIVFQLPSLFIFFLVGSVVLHL